MPPRSTVAPVALAIGALLISMVSYQCGASLAKHLFPQVGTQGATAYRLGLSALILLLWRRTFSTLLSLEPAIAAVAGAALLDQRLSALQWLAIVAIIVAATGTALSVRQPAPAELVN
jgi:threonine/homoserine efflux transporter RhtA